MPVVAKSKIREVIAERTCYLRLVGQKKRFKLQTPEQLSVALMAWANEKEVQINSTEPDKREPVVSRLVVR